MMRNNNENEENGNNFLMVPVSRPLHLDTTSLPSRPSSPYQMVGPFMRGKKMKKIGVS